MDLSIIVPCYNVEKYIEQCLDSLTAIRNISYEIILVNDGSTDKTLDLILKFKDNYIGECCVVNQENRGLSGARNSGMQQAKGEYICFIDSDDYIRPLSLSRIVSMAKMDGVDIGFADYQKCIDGKLVEPREIRKRFSKIKNTDRIFNGCEYAELVYDHLKNNIVSSVCFTIYNNRFIKENMLLFKEGIYHEDTLFFYQSIVKAEKVKYYHELFYIYNIRPNSITTSESKIIKRKTDKIYIAYELLKLKRENEIYCYFLDSYIINLLFVGMNQINVSREGKIDVNNCKKLTIKSRLLKIILKTKGILS